MKHLFETSYHYAQNCSISSELQ